jgi:hypothetical protein
MFEPFGLNCKTGGGRDALDPSALLRVTLRFDRAHRPERVEGRFSKGDTGG